MKKLKVLMIHNFYLRPGGEDIVFQAERDLLRENGHDVMEYTDSNDRITPSTQVSLAAQTIWSWESLSKLRNLLLHERPDIVHFHNTFPLISPASYYACRELGIPVVQTLHNFRFVCPAATLYRDGGVCEKCLSKTLPWPGIRHRCYHQSVLHTGILGMSIFTHKLLRTWQREVDAYIALTESGRQKFIEGGLPANKIMVKPNFLLADPGVKQEVGKFALLVGRLSEEKGILTLLEAWMSLTIPLKIAGDGPMRSHLLQYLQEHNLAAVDYLGALPHGEVISLMKQARILIFPSEWYEGFPLTIAEAFACGLPIVASRLGAMAEIIRDRETGFLFTPGDHKELADSVAQLWNQTEELSRVGRNARREYETKYTPERNYEMLMDIYRHALQSRTKLQSLS